MNEQTNENNERYVTLVAEVQPTLRSVVHSLVRQSADVDDVLQETNVVLWRKRAEYDSQRPFLPWACRVAQLQVLAFFKRVKNSRMTIFSEELLEVIASETIRQAEQNETPREIALRQCLEKLPQQHRELLDIRYCSNEPVKQVAEKMGRSADAVSMTLFRIRKTLLNCIGNILAVEGEE